MTIQTNWKQSRADIFWAEIAGNDHVLQIYQNDPVFLDTLAGFVGSGINAGDCTVVIATREHLKALETRLRNFGIYVDILIADDRYIPVIAEDQLEKFMVNGKPDRDLFMEAVRGFYERARKHNRKLRAFGEMVAILWKKGNEEAALQLEELWNEFHGHHPFSLFCAYPQSAFADETRHHPVCDAHALMINGEYRQIAQVYYKRHQGH